MKRETSSKAANDDQNGKCQTQEKKKRKTKQRKTKEKKKIHRQGKQRRKTIKNKKAKCLDGLNKDRRGFMGG